MSTIAPVPPPTARRSAARSLPRCVLGLLAALWLAVGAAPAHAQSRLKDIVDVEGVRDNVLIGYGLVVGLDGTGDTINNSPFTQQSLYGMLERLGVNIRGTTLTTKNVSAVMVTATLPPFAAQGTRIDVAVGTLGEAKSLQGGILVGAPLLAPDGDVYAVAQGQVAVSGFKAQGQAASITRGVPTAGRIANGALVERTIDFKLSDMQALHLALHNPDFTTAKRISDAINAAVGAGTALATDPANVVVQVPAARRNDLVGFMRDIEQLRVAPDNPATVVIDEASGVIVMGENVRINTVAIAQGNLTIKITETPQVSQPGPLSSGGTTTTVPRTNIQVDDGSGKKLAILPSGVSLQDLVQSLNALGVSPRDMISILQSIKAAGALQADLKVM